MKIYVINDLETFVDSNSHCQESSVTSIAWFFTLKRAKRYLLSLKEKYNGFLLDDGSLDIIHFNHHHLSISTIF